MIVKGTILSRTYRRNKFGKLPWWLLLKIRNEKGKKETISGSAKTIPSVGDFVTASGEPETSKYGPQIKARSLTFLEPQEIDDIIDRISGFDMDLTEEEIKKAVNTHKAKIWKMIEDKVQIWDSQSPERVLEAFLPWKRKDEQEEAVIQILEFFDEKEISLDDRTAKKIAQAIQPGKHGVVHRIVNDVSLLSGLVQIDTLKILMKRMKIERSEVEDALFLAEAIDNCRENRHLCLPREKFEDDEDAIQRLIEKKRLLDYNGFLYCIPARGSNFILEEEVDENEEYRVELLPRGNFDLEEKVSEAVKTLLENQETQDEENPRPKKQIDKALLEGNFKEVVEFHNLNPEQIQGLRNFTEHRISIVTGGPGKGKSKLIAAIADLCDRLSLTTKLCATTALAAKRINELTGKDSGTLHRWLFGKNKDVVDVAVLDESSMLCSVMAYHLFTCGLFNTLVLIGDKNQLQAVGPGAPLIQLLNTEKIPTAILVKNYRFDENSEGISIALKRILKGNSSLSECGNGFTVIETTDVSKKLLRLAKKKAEKGFCIDNFRCFAPTNKFTRAISLELRKIFNPNAEDSDEPFCVKDWVLQTRNDADLDLINGDIGQIISMGSVTVSKEIDIDGSKKVMDIEEFQIGIRFDERDVVVTSTKDLMLAYMTSVHKAQGSESNTVVLCLPFKSRISTRELFYTGASRGKKEVYILGNSEVIEDCIRRREPTRFSCLKDMILEKLLDDE